MNKKELIAALAAKQHCRKVQAKAFLEAFMDVVIERIAVQDEIELIKFGAFRVWPQSSRMARNLQNGKPYLLEPRTSVKFKPSAFFLERINNTAGGAKENVIAYCPDTDEE
ncbi:MAG: HU family DNA-binding protein [Parabacteroides sp.]|nr:HU family DNA-binding protein [Parabacteroides sp.]